MVKSNTNNIVHHKRAYRARPAKNKDHETNMEKADELAEELNLFDKPPINRMGGYRHSQRKKITLAHFSIQDKPLFEVKK